MAFDFDAWRERYDSMTYEDHVVTYAELQRLYPVQQHFDAKACGEFLDMVGARTILEIGGWDGELASLMLATHPEAEAWENVEICGEVVDHPVCTDPRYRAHTTSDFAWVCGCFNGDSDTLVMSHCAEHMRWAELQRLMRMLPRLHAIYLAMPLPEDGGVPDWNCYPGTHILEVGWDEIDIFLNSRGFHQMLAPKTHEVRCWSSDPAPIA